MTWTYDPTDLSTDLAKVRLLVGDTDTNSQQVTDEEINAAIAVTSNIYAAAAWVARALAGKYARQVDTSVESVRRNASSRHKQYLDLAQRFDMQAITLGGGLGTPFVGGVSESDMDSVENDSDRVPPQFRRGMFDNPPGSSFDELRDDD